MRRLKEQKTERVKEKRTSGTLRKEADQHAITDERGKGKRKISGNGLQKERGETCLPLGSHYREAFSIQELGMQLSLQGTDHIHPESQRQTHTYIQTHTHDFYYTHAHMPWAVL